jgi:glycerol-3-phosphate dehydrogenase
LKDDSGTTFEVIAKVLVNAAGNSVKRVRDTINGTPSKEGIRHIKGSHIVVPRVHDGAHAYILQNADKRIVFIIPYHDRYSLIGTTDIAVDAYENPAISNEEVDYLLDLANTYLALPLARSDVVWTYSGVRPLYDDGSTDPSSVTRDYVFKLDTDDGKGAPALSIYGGKITTYRKLAEHALQELTPFLPKMTPRWTAHAVLPGGDMPPGGFSELLGELTGRYSAIPEEVVLGVAHRHGTTAMSILGDAKVPPDLGENFGQGLTAAEIDYLVDEEWARTGDDVLWRRTKCGLGMPQPDRDRVAAYVARVARAA